MKRIFGITLAAAFLATTGCASIINGSDQPISITSEPPGAHFEVRDQSGKMIHQGDTPNTVTLKGGAGYFQAASYTVKVEKDGYYPATTKIDPGISGWYWGNIVFGGLIGLFAVDPATGAMYKIPESSHTSMSPLALSKK